MSEIPYLPVITVLISFPASLMTSCQKKIKRRPEHPLHHNLRYIFSRHHGNGTCRSWWQGHRIHTRLWRGRYLTSCWGAALLNPYRLTGGMVHLTHQAFMKDRRFFCDGAVSVQTQTGKKNISEMDGTRKIIHLPVSAFTIPAVGMAGIPMGIVPKTPYTPLQLVIVSVCKFMGAVQV